MPLLVVPTAEASWEALPGHRLCRAKLTRLLAQFIDEFRMAVQKPQQLAGRAAWFD